MSDPTKSPETPKKGQLSEKQIKLLATMTQNTVGKVEYNWEKIAADSGYKNVASAKTTYSRLCTQLLNSGGGGGSSSKSPADPKTPTKVTKRTGKVGSSSAKKSLAKKDVAAAAAEAGASEGDAQKGEEQTELKGEAEGEATTSGAL